MAKSNFKRTTKKQSRWAGVRCSTNYTQPPTVGTYLLKRLGSKTEDTKTRDQYWRTTCEVVEILKKGPDPEADGKSTPAGTEVEMSHPLTGNASWRGMSDVKSEVMSMAGFEDESEYNEFDPDGELIDAMDGEDNARSAEAEEMENAEFVVVVTRGPDDKKGGYHRNYAYSCAPSDEGEG